jgi:TnpA family transposase
VGRRHAVLLGRAAVPAAGAQPDRPRAVALLPRRGTTTYTHVSDQHSTYGTKVIPTTWREAVAVLDEIFGNPTDLPIAEHTTDTAGQTLATFAIFDLAGLQFSPRIRDIGRLQLYRLGAASAWRSRYPHAVRCSPSPSKPS